MPHDNWLVEKEIVPSPDLDIRAVYIGLLQEITDALKESETVKLGEDVEAETVHIYQIPTVIFAFLDIDKDSVQLFCYRDRREFLKELAAYGDEDYIKEFGLRKFITGQTGEETEKKNI